MTDVQKELFTRYTDCAGIPDHGGMSVVSEQLSSGGADDGGYIKSRLSSKFTEQ